MEQETRPRMNMRPEQGRAPMNRGMDGGRPYPPDSTGRTPRVQDTGRMQAPPEDPRRFAQGETQRFQRPERNPNTGRDTGRVNLSGEEEARRQGRPVQAHPGSERRNPAEKRSVEATEHLSGENPERSVDALILRLEDNLVEAKKMPFTEQCVVDREEMLFLLNLLREALPEELRQAKWLLHRNREVLMETRKEADQILRDAQAQMAHMINEHEVTQKAEAEAQRIHDEAVAQSRQMQNAAIKYVRDLLSETEEQLTDMLLNIQKNKKELD